MHAEHQGIQRLCHGVWPLLGGQIEQPREPVAQRWVQIRPHVVEHLAGLERLPVRHDFLDRGALRRCGVGGEAEKTRRGGEQVALRRGWSAGVEFGRAEPQRLRRMLLACERQAPVLHLEKQAAAGMIGDDEVARFRIAMRLAQVLAHQQRMHELHRESAHIAAGAGLRSAAKARALTPGMNSLTSANSSSVGSSVMSAATCGCRTCMRDGASS
jgi:hypothetical protein